jgi:hypothetical protein
MGQLITLSNVEKRYDMGQEQVRALDGVSLSVACGCPPVGDTRVQGA